MGTPEIKGEVYHDNMVLLPCFPVNVVEAIKELETTIDDVCVATYPKSGTTWTLQILTQLYPEICNPEASLAMNTSFLEMDLTGLEKATMYAKRSSLELCKSRKSPRLLKVHIPARYLKKQVEGGNLKVIYVIRNIKDVLVSYYHHYINGEFTKFQGTFDDFFKLFKARRLGFGHYFDSVLSWLDLCKYPNVLLVKYEDMKEDLVREMKKISRFCGKHFTQDEIEAKAIHCSFQAMKSNPLANYGLGGNLVRKGMVGEWQQYFTEEQSRYVDEMIEQNPDYKKLYEDYKG